MKWNIGNLSPCLSLPPLHLAFLFSRAHVFSKYTICTFIWHNGKYKQSMLHVKICFHFIFYNLEVFPSLSKWPWMCFCKFHWYVKSWRTIWYKVHLLATAAAKQIEFVSFIKHDSFQVLHRKHKWGAIWFGWKLMKFSWMTRSRPTMMDRSSWFDKITVDKT